MLEDLNPDKPITPEYLAGFKEGFELGHKQGFQLDLKKDPI